MWLFVDVIFHSFSISISSAGLPVLVFVVVEVYCCVCFTLIIYVVGTNVRCVFVNLLKILPSCAECLQLWSTFPVQSCITVYL